MDTNEALQHRLALASPAAQTRGMFFESAVVELALLLGPEVAEEARAAASSVRTSSRSPCAAETKPASNADGAR